VGVDPAQIRLGAIVEALVPDPRDQNHKRRPLIVVGFEAEARVVLCAISSGVPDPPPSWCVELPHDDRPGGHPSTGLNRRCFAVCSWVMVLHTRQIVDKRGDLSRRMLGRINSTIERLADEPSG